MRSLNFSRAKYIPVFGIIACSLFAAGCASNHSSAARTVRDAEKLVAQYPAAKKAAAKKTAAAKRKAAPHAAEVPMVAEGPSFAMMPPPPALGPRRPQPGNYRSHLFELYAGQQQIIESLEANDEGPAMDLPSDISDDELVNILQKQQKLIRALTKRSRPETVKL